MGSFETVEALQSQQMFDPSSAHLALNALNPFHSTFFFLKEEKKKSFHCSSRSTKFSDSPRGLQFEFILIHTCPYRVILPLNAFFGLACDLYCVFKGGKKKFEYLHSSNIYIYILNRKEMKWKCSATPEACGRLGWCHSGSVAQLNGSIVSFSFCAVENTHCCAPYASSLFCLDFWSAT